jgi:SAM-dependent methyltransferase
VSSVTDQDATTAVYDRSYYEGSSKSNYADYATLEAAIEKGFMPVVRRYAARAGAGKRPASYLDIGCAFGYYVRALSRLGWDAVGVDVSEYAIGRGKERGLSKILPASATHLPFPDGSFDLVTAIDVVEHLTPEDALRAVSETERVLRKGGLAVYATPNFLDNRYWNTGTPGFEDPDTTHINYQSVASLRELFAGFSECDVRGHTPFPYQFRAFDGSKVFASRVFDLWPARPVGRRIAWKVLGRRVAYSSYLHAVAVK